MSIFHWRLSKLVDWRFNDFSPWFSKKGYTWMYLESRRMITIYMVTYIILFMYNTYIYRSYTVYCNILYTNDIQHLQNTYLHIHTHTILYDGPYTPYPHPNLTFLKALVVVLKVPVKVLPSSPVAPWAFGTTWNISWKLLRQKRRMDDLVLPWMVKVVLDHVWKCAF